MIEGTYFERKITCYSIITSTFAAAAFILCLAATFSCEFISFSSSSGFETPVTVNFGIWSYQFWNVAIPTSEGTTGRSVIFETCHRYGSEDADVDGYWKAARAFSVLTLIFGGISLFANLISSCILSPSLRNTSGLEGPAFLLACIFSGLTFLLLHSDLCQNQTNALLQQTHDEMSNLGNDEMAFEDTCVLASGGKCAIAATVCWFMASLTSCLADVAERKEDERVDDDDDDARRAPLMAGENL